MKKVIRLTESDLTRIVKRVISEKKYNDDKMINENLKNTITSVLIGLSSLISGDVSGQDMFDHTSPIGITNPNNIINRNNSFRDNDFDDEFTYELSQKKILSEIDKINIEDETLIKIKNLIEKNPESKQEFNRILKLMWYFAKQKSYDDILPILTEISKIDIDKLQDKKYQNKVKKHIKNIVVNLVNMRDAVVENNISIWVLIGFVLIMTLFMINADKFV